MDNCTKNLAVPLIEQSLDQKQIYPQANLALKQDVLKFLLEIKNQPVRLTNKRLEGYLYLLSTRRN